VARNQRPGLRRHAQDRPRRRAEDAEPALDERSQERAFEAHQHEIAKEAHSALAPERLGRPRGAVILVNRQLATANAFEDLLHERWPRCGRLARRLYDRLGLPVRRLIRSRVAADLVYLAMKPAEWLFYVALLLLDRRPPEERLARMYPNDEGGSTAPKNVMG
jgi:hypothetical protein